MEWLQLPIWWLRSGYVLQYLEHLKMWRTGTPEGVGRGEVQGRCRDVIHIWQLPRG